MSLLKNPNTASAYANLMFLDFLGTGFSFVNDTKDLPDNYSALAAQVTKALNEFSATIDFGKGKLVFVRLECLGSKLFLSIKEFRI
jgi:carboxypeptidase C (cathepsin A)